MNHPKSALLRRRGKRVAGAVLVVLLLAIYPVKRALELAADPSGPKDCGPPVPDRDTGVPAAARLPHAPDLPWSQTGGTINDASCLNRTPVHGVVRVTQIDDVARALRFARDAGLKVSIAGVRHSMGGHAFARRAIVLDMTHFNRMSLDARAGILTVQSGATWHDIQNLLHPRFAVTAMQSTDIFTVGGSIAVNAHGMDHHAGSVGRTIRAMRVMMPDATIRHVSRARDPRLFSLIVGGYGLFGVILDADLEITPNVVYRSERRVLDYREFPAHFAAAIRPDRGIGLMYAHLSTAPQSFLRELLLYTYREVEAPGATVPPLGAVGQVKLRRLVFNTGRLGPLGARLKWAAEKYAEPRLESCPVSRNQALGEGEACLVSRNEPMHDSVAYLRNNLSDTTDILQEYFVPVDRFATFVDAVRGRLRGSPIALLNASVRVALEDDNLLTYAPDDRLALVLYLSQSADRRGTEQMAALTSDLIDLAGAAGGRFFLPYQLHYSPAQLERAYPEIREFFRAKRELDPEALLTSTFYEKYAPTLGPTAVASRPSPFATLSVAPSSTAERTAR